MFTHIYIESQVLSHQITKDIVQHFPDATIIEIENYKQFFNRPNQNFIAQRKQQHLILAKQEEHFFHFGSDRVRSFGDPLIVSCSMVRNCVYHCEYCFLSGMHESANIVIYVNIEDYEREIITLAKEQNSQKIYLVSSYLSDLPAFEYFVPICRMWMHITKSLENVELEIRTKSDAYRFLQAIGAQGNTVLTWSLSPQEIVRKYEHGTASLHTRILHASQAIKDGWRVRLCFDPILYYNGWQEEYRRCLAQTFARCNAEQIEKVSYGVFRMGTQYLQKMRKLRPSAGLLQNHVQLSNGLGTYPAEVLDEIQDCFATMLAKYLPKEKYHFVHG